MQVMQRRRIGWGAFLVACAIAGYVEAQAYHERAVPLPIAPVPANIVSVNPSTVYAWPRATVYVEDHTGNRWDIHRAVYDWQWGTRVNVIYGGCRHAMPCVRVYEGNYGRTGYVGRTVYDSVPNPGKWHWTGRTWVMGGVTRIYMNNSYPTTVRQRQQAACHETGHSLGIIDHTGPDSCMYYKNGAQSIVPTIADRAALNRVYATVRF